MTIDKKKLEIIGVAGTNGAGKDSLGHILAEHHNYLFISVTDLLRAEAERRGMEPIRENTRQISAEWRRELGLGVLVDKAVAEYEVSKDKYSGVVMSSLRNPGENDRVHEYGGIVVWVDAAPKVRYERIQRATNRDRHDDQRTFEQFLTEEEAEMYPPPGADDAMLNVAEVKNRCDLVIDNSQEDLVAFRRHVEHVLWGYK